jgi:uncharacterized protein
MAEQKIDSKKTDKRKDYGPRSAVLVTISIYFGAQLLAAIGLGIYAAIAGIDSEVISNLVENSIPTQFVYILLFEILSLYFLWIFISRRRVMWSEIGLKKPQLSNFFYAPLVYLAYFITLLIVVALVGAFVPSINIDQPQQIGFDGASGGLELALVFVSLVLLPAVVEEILVRGFLYGGLIKKYSKLIAALFASVIFAAAHLQFGSGEPLLWVAAIDTFILSMALIWLRERTGNIWSGVFVHMIKNGVAFVSLFILKVN